MREQKSTRQIAKEDLGDALWASKGFESPKKWRRISDKNHLIVENVCREELGEFGDPLNSIILDSEKRDTIIAHGREDAAHALANTISLLEGQERIKRQLFWLYILIIGCSLVLFFK